MSRRGRSLRADTRTFVPYDAPTDFEQEDVAIMVSGSTSDGTRSAVLLPRSMQRLSGEAREAAHDLQRLGLELQELADAIDQCVEECRDVGVSWSVIGWCMGTTGEAARQRWGP